MRPTSHPANKPEQRGCAQQQHPTPEHSQTALAFGRHGQQCSMKEQHHGQQAECLGILLVRVLANDRPGPEQHPPEHRPRSGHHQQQASTRVLPQPNGLIRQQIHEKGHQCRGQRQKHQNRSTTRLTAPVHENDGHGAAGVA